MVTNALTAKLDFWVSDLYRRREAILKRHAQNKRKSVVSTLSENERELLDRFQPYGEGDLDEDGKPKMVLYLHNRDPVPEKWRK
jgi:hypothetical protein